MHVTLYSCKIFFGKTFNVVYNYLIHILHYKYYKVLCNVMCCITIFFSINYLQGIVFRMVEGHKVFPLTTSHLSIWYCYSSGQSCYLVFFFKFSKCFVVVILFVYVVSLSVFGVSIPCHYCFPLFISILHNIRQPCGMLMVSYFTKPVDKGCLGTPHVQRF